ncbi:glycosyltransferase family 4 protein [Rhabdobacter roseus]
MVFVNSIANAKLYAQQLTYLHHLPTVLFVHELGMSVKMYTEKNDLDILLKKSNHLIAVAQAVANHYIQHYAYPADSVSIFTLIDHQRIDRQLQEAQPNLLERTFNIPVDALVIGGCGNAEWRKGNDIFNWVARIVLQKTNPLPVYFVWVGAGPQHEIYQLISSDIERMGLADKIILIPPTAQALDYISRFDVLLLSSREDPYPLVVMEAALNEIPVVCFEGAGGAPELIEQDAGFVVPYMDISAASNALVQLIQNADQRLKMGQKARQKVLERHNTTESVRKVKAIIEKYLILPVSETHNP